MSYRDQSQAERDAEYYRQQYEDLRDEQRRQRERESQGQIEARKQREEERREAMCYADDWPDGFYKGISRARQEAREENALNKELIADPQFADMVTDNWFEKWVAQLESGQKIYIEEVAAAQAEIERLESAIEEVKANARLKAAARIESSGGDRELAEALRSNNPNYLTNW